MCGCVFVCLENKTKEREEKKRNNKKRDELECVGGVISRKITGADGMYVRGVAVVASVDIDRSILIIPRGLLCLLCLLRVVHNTVLRCW